MQDPPLPPVSIPPDLWRDLYKTICSSVDILAPGLALFPLIIFPRCYLRSAAGTRLDEAAGSEVRRRRRRRANMQVRLAPAVVLRGFAAVRPGEL